MMGRVTNYSKEYLLFKSMVYVEEYGMKSITARELAEFCGCSTYRFIHISNQSAG